MKRGIDFIISLFCVFTLAGCNRIDYNAKIVKDEINFNDDWVNANQVYDSYNFETNKWDTTSPKDRTYVLNTQEQIDEVYSYFPNINLDEQMLIVYCYRNVYVREQKLKNVTLDDGLLNVEFDIAPGKLGHADAASPHTRMCTIKLNKVDYKQVKVTYKGK